MLSRAEKVSAGTNPGAAGFVSMYVTAPSLGLIDAIRSGGVWVASPSCEKTRAAHTISATRIVVARHARSPYPDTAQYPYRRTRSMTDGAGCLPREAPRPRPARR